MAAILARPASRKRHTSCGSGCRPSPPTGVSPSWPAA